MTVYQTNDLKADKRKKYFLVLDVETAGTLNQKLTYDVGFAVVDKTGKIYAERSYIIKEIFEQKHLMNTAYYAEKVPSYLKEINEGKHQVVSFWKMREELFRLMTEYNTQTFCAYNLNFDMNALKNTTNYLLNDCHSVNGNYKFLTPQFKNLKLLCIWSLACETLFHQKSFAKFAVKNGFYSEAGNYRTSAEVAYAYMTNEPTYKEEHKGLEDVYIEAQILARCLRQKKKFVSGIIPMPYRLVTKVHGKVSS